MNEWSLPENTQESTIERLGGGYIWESGVYPVIIKSVYLDQAESEAVSFNIILENKEGKELKEVFYIKSGKEKGNKSYYTKDGKNYPLLGYSVADSLCVAATEQHLDKILETLEHKVINIYNVDAGKEVPTERPVPMSLIGKPIKVAVHQVLENKRKKNTTTGIYEEILDTRTINQCKFFGNM